MKWFAIVLMMNFVDGQSGGVLVQDLWALNQSFESEEECFTFAKTNKHTLFFKAIQSYDFQFDPQKIICVNEDRMKKIWMEDQNLLDNKLNV